MYGFGFLVVVLLPLLTSATPKTDSAKRRYCCTITTKVDFPDHNPNDYLKVPCDQYEGDFKGTESDLRNFVWRAECHNVINVPDHLHEEPLGVINVDCKKGKDACE